MEYKISRKCCNYNTVKTCLKCGKCGRRFRKGILVDDYDIEWRNYINDCIRKENNGETGA